MEASISLSTLPVFASFHLEKSEVKSCKKIERSNTFWKRGGNQGFGWFLLFGSSFYGFPGCNSGRWVWEVGVLEGWSTLCTFPMCIFRPLSVLNRQVHWSHLKVFIAATEAWEDKSLWANRQDGIKAVGLFGTACWLFGEGYFIYNRATAFIDVFSNTCLS